ncbi:MAG: hypothetical protein P8Y81_06310 [Ignavibacteriaceae bacterium]
MNKHLVIAFFLFICFFFSIISCTEEAAESKRKIFESVRDTTVIKDPDYFFFVGNGGTYTGIYKYDFTNDSYGIFWSARNEIVVKLLYSNDLQYIYFLTARSFGIRNGISYISNLKLYRLITDKSLVEFVADIGDAIQIYTYWEGIDFRIQFTSFDLRVATYINRTNQIYSPFGKLIQQTVDVFDFIKNGYPGFEIPGSSSKSPSGRSGFIQKEDSLFFESIPSKKRYFVDTVKASINKIVWNGNEHYAFISTSSENANENEAGSVLIAYNIVDNKLEHEWTSEAKINFFNTETYLIFDLVNEGKSSVNIYNYKKAIDLKKVTLRNGCGVTGIP